MNQGKPKQMSTLRTARYIIVEGQGHDSDKELRLPSEYVRAKDNNGRYTKDKNGNFVRAENGQWNYKFAEYDDDKSEVQFWRTANEALFDNKFIIKPLNGNFNVIPVLDALLERGTTKQIIVCLDWFANDNVSALIKRVDVDYTSKCKKSGVKFRVVYRYTFEWAILSFEHLIRWLFAQEILNSNSPRIQRCSNLHDLFTKLSFPESWRLNEALMENLKHLDGYSTIYTDEDVTFEQVCSDVLEYITFTTGRLKINKKNLGDCWKCSCNQEGACHHLNRYHELESIPKNIRCGLVENNRLSLEEKYKYIFLYSRGLTRFPKIGKLE